MDVCLSIDMIYEYGCLQWILFFVFVALVKYLILTSYTYHFKISRPLSQGEKEKWKIETYYFERTLSVNVLL